MSSPGRAAQLFWLAGGIILAYLAAQMIYRGVAHGVWTLSWRGVKFEGVIVQLVCLALLVIGLGLTRSAYIALTNTRRWK
jgi:hypothetical protein